MFKDHFSEQADDYATYRPSYPVELADFLGRIAPRREIVWEAGCGSGQLTALLARHFGRVFATDASAEQLAKAPPFPNVEYHCVRAEDTGLAAGTADLCIAAQAAHWFDLEAYYAEVRRIGRQDAIIALITYGLMEVTPEIDARVRTFYETATDAYWPPERRFVEAGYANLPFPFEEMECPPLEMRAEWSLEKLLGYIRTWSGVRRMIEAAGPEPFEALAQGLSAAWGDPNRERTVRWPLSMRLGPVSVR